jgi:hypothetical protein
MRFSQEIPPRLATELRRQFAESQKLEAVIEKNLRGLGYGA